MMRALLRSRIFFIVLSFGLMLISCGRTGISFRGPIPEARDVESPGQLDSDLARLRIRWKGSMGESISIRLDSTEQAALIPGCGNPSPSGRFVLCDPYYGSDIELLDLSSEDRRVLVTRKQIGPAVTDLSYANFTPDEREVVFQITWENATDPAFVNIETGEIEVLDAPGIFNSDPVVSPDGRWILVSCEGDVPGAGFVLCIINRETKERVRLLNEATNIPRTGLFTPHGQSVVYTAPFGGSLGEGRLYRLDLKDRSITPLVSGLHPTDGVLGVTEKAAAFTCRDPERPACSWVCVVDLEGKEVQRLTYLGESCIDLDAP